ncbi:Nucleoid occlusion protein [subsurface metagenome]
MVEISVPEAVSIPVEKLFPSDDNPNRQTGDTFGALVKSIQELGFVEPILVRRRADSDEYDIVSGDHRWQAAKVLSMEKVPCVAVDDLSDDQVGILLVRMNAIRGNIDPVKFTKLFNKLRKKHSPDYLRAQMAMTSETVFGRLYKDVRKSLPPEVKRRLDETKEEIQDVDGLARAIQRVMAEFGSDLELQFIVFQFGGQRHVLVQASSRTWANLERIIEECREREVDINEHLNRLLEKDVKFK